MKNQFKTLEFIYQDTQIHFLLNNNDDDVMINATDMANAFGKRVEDYKRLESTKKLIFELQNINFGHADVREQKVIYATNKSTFMCRILALDFAAWLDIKFKIWIYQTIETVLFGHYKEHWDAHIMQERAKNRMEELRRKLLTNATQEDVQEYFETERTLIKAKNIKQKAIQNQYKLAFPLHN